MARYSFNTVYPLRNRKMDFIGLILFVKNLKIILQRSSFWSNFSTTDNKKSSFTGIFQGFRSYVQITNREEQLMIAASVYTYILKMLVKHSCPCVVM